MSVSSPEHPPRRAGDTEAPEMRLGDLPLGALVERIGSTAPAPGCGAAAGAVLALAAACARKAVAISAKHAPDPRLDRAGALLARIAEAALAAGDADADHFAGLIAALRQPRDPGGVAAETNALAAVASRLLDLATRLRGVIAGIAPLIADRMQGDVAAALALAQACETIARGNLAEASP